jgi:carbonic anhydrase
MYVKTKDHRQDAASKVNERLGSGQFAGPCSCCSGRLGLDSSGSLSALSSSAGHDPQYVKWVKRSLNRILERRMIVDGNDSTQYRNAIRVYQQRTNLSVDGKVGRQTQDQLIKNNEEDTAYAKWVQQALNKHGACLNPNGRLQTTSKNAIKRFQSCQNITSDGVVGFQTELRLILEGGGLPPGHIAGAHGIKLLPQPLKDGNERWIPYWNAHPQKDFFQTNQNPSVTILGCSDSRVAPEDIFNSHIGSIFTIRTAGQVLDDAVRGTLQYAAANLKTGLFVVLGHEDCGAVKAAVAKIIPSGPLGKLVQDIVNVIEEGVRKGVGNGGLPAPPLSSAPSSLKKEFLVACIKENAKAKAMQVQEEFGLPKVIPAYYSLETGEVKVLKF